MEYLFEIAVFIGKTLSIVIGFIVVIAFIASLAHRTTSPEKGSLKVEDLGEKYKKLTQLLKSRLLKKKAFKALQKKTKKQEKTSAKSEKPLPKLFVLEFEGDVKASHVENLREEISSLLTVAEPGDEVLCVIESPGGMVHTYGLAASQLQRIKEHGLKLTAAVDKVAASGGYLMACVADEIIAAPFAIIGSIGVVAQVPNINRLLKKHDVDYHEYTAGEYKRTVSLLGRITPEGEEKFLDQLHDTHQLFKDFVGGHRPQLAIETVATGEYWYGTRAKELGLIDAIQTSDDYLMRATKTHKVYKLSYQAKKSLSDKLSEAMQKGSQSVFSKAFEELNRRFF